MSSPGDPGRRSELLEGTAEDIVAKAVELVGTVPGATSFELAYDTVDRVLGEDEEPRPDDRVRWTASAELRRKYAKGTKPVTRTITGTAIAEAGANHGEAMVLAVVDLLENLGANVVLMFGGNR
jgi:hypothetical protein